MLSAKHAAIQLLFETSTAITYMVRATEHQMRLLLAYCYGDASKGPHSLHDNGFL